MFDCITVQYNLLDRQLEDAIAYARAKQIGVVVMGPVGGGRLGAPTTALDSLLPEVRRIPELALRFVWSNPGVNVALSGMSTLEQVEENLILAAERKSLDGGEERIVREHLDRLKQAADLYCTGCNYCLPCPEGVKIPAIFSLYNQARVYGLWAHARKRYADWRKTMPQWDQGFQADACVECGVCETRCPQRIPIRNQLKEAHAALDAPVADVPKLG
jgi:predicted aldo/keto reductase-like oxidoreductase